ncbi:MAG: hypothetical protein ABIZ18_11870 [Caldimonas sp.]
MPLSDKARDRLARDLARAVTRAAPDWTGSNASDPGVTMLELLTFVADDLLHHRATLSPHAHRIARDLSGRSAALADAGTGASDDCVSGLERVSYFFGQILGADDFETEQAYLRGRLGRRNRLLHGTGIVAGLDVAIDASAGAVVIAPGLAFAPDGNEIGLDAPVALALPASGTAWLVQVAYREAPCRSVVSQAGTATTRIVETFDASLAAMADASAVPLARVHRVRGRWRVDAKFAPPRIRR